MYSSGVLAEFQLELSSRWWGGTSIHYKKTRTILTAIPTAAKFVGNFWRISDRIPTKYPFSCSLVFRRKFLLKLRQNKRCREISTPFRPQAEERIYLLHDLFKCFEFFIFVGIYRPQSEENIYPLRGFFNVLYFFYFRLNFVGVYRRNSDGNFLSDGNPTNIMTVKCFRRISDGLMLFHRLCRQLSFINMCSRSFPYSHFLTLFTTNPKKKNHVFAKLLSFVDGWTSFGSKRQLTYGIIRRRCWRIHEACSTTTRRKYRYVKMSLLFLQ